MIKLEGSQILNRVFSEKFLILLGKGGLCDLMPAARAEISFTSIENKEDSLVRFKIPGLAIINVSFQVLQNGMCCCRGALSDHW